MSPWVYIHWWNVQEAWEAAERSSKNNLLFTPRGSKTAGKIKFQTLKCTRPVDILALRRCLFHHYNQFNQSILFTYLFSSCQRCLRKQRQTKFLLKSQRDLLIPFEQMASRHFCKTSNKNLWVLICWLNQNKAF